MQRNVSPNAANGAKIKEVRGCRDLYYNDEETAEIACNEFTGLLRQLGGRGEVVRMGNIVRFPAWLPLTHPN